MVTTTNESTVSLGLCFTCIKIIGSINREVCPFLRAAERAVSSSMMFFAEWRKTEARKMGKRQTMNLHCVCNCM